MRKREILVVLGTSAYGSVTEFARELTEAWRRECRVEVLDGRESGAYDIKRKEILEGRHFDLVFSFNALLQDDRELAEHLMEGEGVYCTWLLDHPIHHHSRLLRVHSRSLVLAPDAFHRSYLERCYPNLSHVGFLPHGGSGCTAPVPFRDRTIDVCFFGSYGSSQRYREKLRGMPEVHRVLEEELMDQLKAHPQWTIEQAFSYMIEVYQMEEAPEDIPNDLAAMRDADLYIRSYYREQVLSLLLDAGIPIDVYGEGWEEFDCRGRALLRVHPPCGYRDTLEVTGNARIALNVMPWFKAGSHERVFNALACGAVALTDRSSYWEQLEDQAGLVMYDLAKLDELPGIVREILCEDFPGEAVSRRGMRNAEKNHLWAHRAEELLSCVEQMERMD